MTSINVNQDDERINKEIDFSKIQQGSKWKSILKRNPEIDPNKETLLEQSPCADYTGISLKLPVGKTGFLSLTNYRIYFECKLFGDYTRNIELKYIESIVRGTTTLFEMNNSIEIQLKNGVEPVSSKLGWRAGQVVVLALMREKDRDHWYNLLTRLLQGSINELENHLTAEKILLSKPNIRFNDDKEKKTAKRRIIGNDEKNEKRDNEYYLCLILVFLYKLFISSFVVFVVWVVVVFVLVVVELVVGLLLVVVEPVVDFVLVVVEPVVELVLVVLGFVVGPVASVSFLV